MRFLIVFNSFCLIMNPILFLFSLDHKRWKRKQNWKIKKLFRATCRLWAGPSFGKWSEREVRESRNRAHSLSEQEWGWTEVDAHFCLAPFTLAWFLLCPACSTIQKRDCLQSRKYFHYPSDSIELPTPFFRLHSSITSTRCLPTFIQLSSLNFCLIQTYARSWCYYRKLTSVL